MSFFITRPIFATALALLMILTGSVCLFLLPISQYPPLVPPQVQVTTQYIAADAKVVADSVTTPLEEQLNGSSGMIYMSSNSTDNGDTSITVTFEVGFDQNVGQMELLSRTNTALSQLPPEVKQVGVTVIKNSPNILLAVSLSSPNGTYDGNFLQNYATIHIVDPLSRIPGVSQVTNFGASDYAMRIWLDPQKLSNMDLTATDVQKAIADQNQQAASGKVGQAPAPAGQAFQYQVSTEGRLVQSEQFGDIIVRVAKDGSIVRIRDVARVELGSQEYDWMTYLNCKETATIAVFQLSNANGIQIKQRVVETLEQLEQHFPEDVVWETPYDTTRFVEESIWEVLITLFQAIILVLLVVFIFLQQARATLIPMIAVPVSLIATFAVMLPLGFSINSVSLLGLVLAVALVVDDAIVVVENVMRHLEEGGEDIVKITRQALAEVRSPIFVTTLVLLAVFIPVACMPGLTGRLYNQFSITIAIAVTFSCINSLSLSPALCAVFLAPQKKRQALFFRVFNNGFQKLVNVYVAVIRMLTRVWYLLVLAFAGLCVLTIHAFLDIPKGFIPEEDQGYVLLITELPEGATIHRTQSAMDKATKIVLQNPGMESIVAVAGYNVIDQIKQPNMGISFLNLKDWSERKTPQLSAFGIIESLEEQLQAVPEARFVVINAPPIPGLASTAGFTMEVQDLNNLGIPALDNATQNLITRAMERPELGVVYTTFNADFPELYLDIDRTKVFTHGVSLKDLFSTLQANLGSLYVNEFNRFGRVYRVYIQAESDARAQADDLLRLYVRNNKNEMIELSAFVKIKETTGPYNISHYNLYPSISVQGTSAPGFSSGDGVKAMQEVVEQVLPSQFGTSWTGLVYQQLKASGMAPIIFGFSVVFVFLVLAALYESWTIPIVVLLGVPLGMLGAVGCLLFRGLDLDVFGQIGLVVLIGLVAKNGILIVEFAQGYRKKGASIMEATVTAARIRLRPILMTALAFIIGLMPLVLATGAGASARRSLGTTVVGGLALATMLIMVVPVFYYIIERLRTGWFRSEAASSGSFERTDNPDNPKPA